ncbi:hypothetical protein RAJCM14343_5103 [Rhodococcus aetherivorans]|uniref:Uncharacterized protein n=1 Tax=Rhodococcus aetherivorans TaxID=191292 RepID=A0ABQ0YTH0_9NOCA|nr:hypothetical protein RAJCM14343_5103 [Rhodococcus aetherivorans]
MRGEVRDGRGWARRIAARGRARGLPSRRSPARGPVRRARGAREEGGDPGIAHTAAFRRHPGSVPPRPLPRMMDNGDYPS